MTMIFIYMHLTTITCLKVGYCSAGWSKYVRITTYSATVVTNYICTSVSNIIISDYIAICCCNLIGTGSIIIDDWIAYFCIDI